MTSRTTYSYAATVKSDASDELINVYVLRPAAGLLVRFLCHTPVTPNQVTVTAIVWGILAASLYAWGVPILTLLAGLCLTVKDILDSADGQLARAKHMYSRAGRFLDSIGDFLVNILVFASFTYALTRLTGTPWIPFAGLLGFLGISLRVSYHVFYQVSYLHLSGTYPVNRRTEEIRADDLMEDPVTLTLQRIFLVLYGWQDRLMAHLDSWCRGDRFTDAASETRWYGDRVGLRLSGLLGIGTELFLLTICSVLNVIEVYLGLNLVLMNGVWLVSILYRKAVLAPRLHG